MEGGKLTMDKKNLWLCDKKKLTLRISPLENLWLWDKKKLSLGISPLENHGERANPKVFHNL
jgi:hypothetical protein